MSAKEDVRLYYFLFKVERKRSPWPIWIFHVEAVNIKVEIIKATDLENEATVDDHQSWMQLADWEVWQLAPIVSSDVKAIAFCITDRHRAHSHIQSHGRDAARYNDLLPTEASAKCELRARHISHLHYIPRTFLKLQILI